MLCRQSHTWLARKCGILLCRSRVVLYFWGGQCTIAGVSLCPVQFSVEGHQFRVIASDGGDIKPVLAGNTNQHNYKIAKITWWIRLAKIRIFFKESLHFTRQCRKLSFLGGNLNLVTFSSSTIRQIFTAGFLIFIPHHSHGILMFFSCLSDNRIIHNKTNIWRWYSHVYQTLL